MDAKQFVGILRRRWRSIAAVVGVALVLTGLLTFVVAKPQYQSTARVFLSVNVQNATDAYSAVYFANTRAASYADVAQSTELAARVVSTLGLNMTAKELSDHISAVVVANTSLIELTVKDTNAKRAQSICNAATTAFTAYVKELENTSTDAKKPTSPIAASVTDKATYEPNAVSPRSGLNLAVALILGLMLGIALALVRDLLDRTVHASGDVSDITDAPVLATINYDDRMHDAPVLTDVGGFAPRTEAFRLLRTNLQFVDLDRDAKCLLITSSVKGEGKTTTAMNLAVAMAQAGRRTLLIDADLRRPRAAATLGLDPAVGLTTVLVGRTEVHEAIQIHEPSGLHVLASGAKPPNPTEILQSHVTHDLIRELTERYDTVIIDAPPMLPVADSSVLATLADGVILVIRHAHTTKDEAHEAAGRIAQVDGRLYGVVVNMVASRAAGSYYYYYEDAPAKRG
ncbi:polysaccharide biosynthesis tyrosine autokinase [Nocardioides sp. Kera G14]|uniref:polysaccharide biosynthesis tyrosine autokinase n=1 Tax=Nocardioides sp. Kera G14 TaxID=2884264 RepID=UPI001D11CD67|nr:polysaccharide biosynthesis tyrosine autokinase [Nocardioides sp. Kera G14]UDY23606.1 polysaccharide biosynthesis tyrosine autokinase [Nocardioides sp. Kera G14]